MGLPALIGAAGAGLRTAAVLHKAYTKTQTKTMEKRRTVTDKGGYQQLTKDRDHFGRRLPKVQRLLNITASHMHPIVERWQDCSAGTASEGSFFLGYANNTPATSMRLPCYLFDLTCVRNVVQNPITGAITEAVPLPMRRLCRDINSAAPASRNTYHTEMCHGINSVGGLDATWLIEETSGLTNTTGKQSMLNWLDIRMLMYGAQTRPSRVNVKLVQFVDDECAIQGEYYITGQAGTFVQNREPTDADVGQLNTDYGMWHDFWDGETDQLIGNPIAKRGSLKAARAMKVLYSKQFQFNPTSSTEDDRRGHQKEFYLRYDMDKIHTYAEGPPDEVNQVPYPTVDNIINPDRWAVNDRNLNSTFVNPKGRTYLMITGMTMEQGPTAHDVKAGLRTIDASFDLIVRRKRTMLHR